MGKYSLKYSEIKQNVIEDEDKRRGGGGATSDGRFWKFTFDKETKVGSAIIRFLPDPNGTPYKVYYSHWFNWAAGGTSGIYTRNCPTSIGLKCPVCDKNRALYKSVHKRDNKLSSDRKRKFHAVSNILVLKDPGCPENEGKVFLWDYGVQIYEKYKKAMFGGAAEEAAAQLGEEEITFFPCEWYDKTEDGEPGGADFIVLSNIKPNTDWMSYVDSRFKDVAHIFPELTVKQRDTQIGNLITQLHDLSEWDKENKYPDFEDIRKELAPILGALPVDDSDDETGDEAGDDTGDDSADDAGDDSPREASPRAEPKDEPSGETKNDEEFIQNILNKSNKKGSRKAS